MNIYVLIVEFVDLARDIAEARLCIFGVNMQRNVA
jgi:hypothetical protein